MILVLITVGKLLEAKSKGRTADALRSLMKLAPKTATVVRNGQETEIPIEELQKGEIFAVRPGESIPVDKTSGDSVSAATVNQSGFIRCEAVRVGEDTTLSQIIRLVSDAAATKAPIAKIADKMQMKEGFRIVSNCGESAGQSVKHLHFHLMYGRDFTWPAG